MAELFRSTPFQLGIFQQDHSYRPSSTPSTEGSSSSHSVELAHNYSAHHAPGPSGYEASFYDPAMKAEYMERTSSATSGDSENPTPSSSGLDYAPPSAAERTRMINAELGRAKSRRRTTPDQLAVLEKQFESNPKPDIDLRKKLAEQLTMTPREVQVWFQNRRAKAKKLAKRAEEDQDAVHEDYQEHEAVPVPSYASGSTATINWSAQLGANLGAQRGALPSGPSLYSEGWPSNSYMLQPAYAPETWSIPPATSSSLDPLLADVLASTAPEMAPPLLATAMPLPAGPSSLQLPLLPRAEPFMSESGPSSSSTVFTNFAFGDAAARRGSAASIDSFLTEASETGTVSGTLTPVSTAGSIAGFDGLLPPGFDATRRSSCPPELIAHLQEANLAQTNPVWALEQLVSSPPSVASARQSSFASMSNPATHQAHFALMNNLGRRHSVAVDAPYASSSSLSPRRSSVAASLDPIAEHDQMMTSPNGMSGVLRRASAARKSRSQASMRQHLVRPVPTLPDGQVPITSAPQFDM